MCYRKYQVKTCVDNTPATGAYPVKNVLPLRGFLNNPPYAKYATNADLASGIALRTTFDVLQKMPGQNLRQECHSTGVRKAIPLARSVFVDLCNKPGYLKIQVCHFVNPILHASG